jgi:mono/diheme cytochrome c family protein
VVSGGRLGRTARAACVAASLSLVLAACTDVGSNGAGSAASSSAAVAAPRGSAALASPSASANAPAAAAEATLTFARDGRELATLRLDELLAKVPLEQWTAFDPYYNKPKTWRAVPVAAVVRLGLTSALRPGERLEDLDYVLRARDGYTVPLPGAKLFEAGGYIAFADVDVPDWEAIGPQRANPAPFYLVWREKNQHALETHPRPWQLARIEIAAFEATFPHTVPAGAAPDSAAGRGYRIFREQCILCHAMNREGGRVGPDLNVPRSIVEYRPDKQVREYIRDPRSFRYGNMPAHPHLKEADLDALMAYFRAMKELKHDPGATDGGAH